MKGSIVLCCLSAMACGSVAQDEIGERTQALAGHILTITPHTVDPAGGWGPWWSNPDPEGCNANQRTDCIRFFHDAAWLNQIVWPPEAVGSTGYIDQDIEINKYGDCAHVPTTINSITMQATVYSAPGVQGTLNRVQLEAKGFSNDHELSAPLGPNFSWDVESITWTLTHSPLQPTVPIPKKAICSDFAFPHNGDSRYEFVIERYAPDFINDCFGETQACKIDTADTFSIADVQLKAWW